MANLTELPSTITAGTTVIYTRSNASYPANAGWTMTLYLAGPSVLSSGGSASGANFIFTLSYADTTKLAGGNYQWQEIASNGTQKYLAASGVLTVSANIAAAGAGDFLTWEESTLAVVEDVLAGRISADTQAYTIAGRAVTKIPAMELLSIRASLKRAVEAQKHPGKLGPQVKVVFTGVNSEVDPVPFRGGF